MIDIREATKSQAADIARLVMMAMTDDCCLHFLWSRVWPGGLL